MPRLFSQLTFEDLPVGTRVKVVTSGVDFHCFHEDTGTVIRNSGKYLGVRVEFDEPRLYEGGRVQKDFNFNPKNLAILDAEEYVKKLRAECEARVQRIMAKPSHKPIKNPLVDEECP